MVHPCSRCFAPPLLQGDITTWLHPDILALNPDGLVHRSQGLLTDATQAIQLKRGPVAGSRDVQELMRTYAVDYNGSAITAAPSFPTEDMLRAAVVQSPYALTLTPLIGNLALKPIQFLRSDGHKANASWETVRACASSEVMNKDANHFALQVPNALMSTGSVGVGETGALGGEGGGAYHPPPALFDPNAALPHRKCKVFLAPSAEPRFPMANSFQANASPFSNASIAKSTISRGRREG